MKYKVMDFWATFFLVCGLLITLTGHWLGLLIFAWGILGYILLWHWTEKEYKDEDSSK